MWDWELLKKGSGQFHYQIIGQYGNEDFQYTHVISYGSEEDEFYLHNHSMYELVYCIRGDAVYQVDGVRYVVEPNSLLVINPTAPHRMFICSSSPLERHILYIYYAGNTSPLSSLIGKLPHNSDGKRFSSMYFSPQKVEKIDVFYQRLSMVCRSKDNVIRDLVPFFAQSLTAQLLAIMYEQKPSQFSVGTSRTVDTLLTYLNKNFTQNLSLAEIAERFNLSKDYCNRIFRNATGMTVMQYIIYSRVLYAKQLLAEGVPAVEASTRVGFADYSNFYRSYRKVTGRTPSEDYRIG